MTFFSGNTDMDALLNKIADELINTGSWLDADAAVSGSKRVVRHAVDANFYVLLERVASPGYNGFTIFRLNEIKVTVSSGWDSVGHLPTGTQEVTSIPAESWQTGQSNYPFYDSTTTGSGNKTGQYYLWADSSGVTLLATWTASNSHYDYTSFFHLERNTTKEYADGFTNFFLLSLVNEDRTIYYSSYQFYVYRAPSGNDYSLNRKQYIRPFNTSTIDYALAVATFFDCYKSAGNSKVYFQFPYYSNNLDPLRRTPIAQTQRWFRVGVGLGVADGDLIDWVNGAETWKFLAKTLQSPDSTNYLPIAIRYA